MASSTPPSQFAPAPVHEWFSVHVKNQYIQVPAKPFKNQETTVAIAPHPYQCLLIYPIYEWEKLEKKIASLPDIMSGGNQVVKNILNAVEKCAIQQQKLQIPQIYLDLAEIQNEAVWAIADTHVQLWQPARFEKNLKI